MQRVALFLIIFFSSFLASAQITTEPAFPVAGEPVRVIFDSKQESRLGAFSGDLYAHTGVGIEGAGNWQHVIGNWGQNTAQSKLTFLGNGVYELRITPTINDFYSVGLGETVTNMSFVFRNSAGSQQTNDLFVTVYQTGLNLDMQFPTANAIIERGTSYNFKAVTSSSASLRFYLDDALLGEVAGDAIDVPVQFETAGEHKVKVTAQNSEGMFVADSTFICVRGEQITESLPSGAKKGITYTGDQSVRLVLFAPEKSYVFVLGDFNDWKPMNRYQMKKDGDYFWLDVDGLQKGKEYVFQYFIDSELRIADPYTEKISDPWNDDEINSSTYPNLIDYPAGKTDQIAAVLQTGQETYSWNVTDFETPATEKLSIYELLVRDFTDEHTYQEVIDKLDYLKDLQINVLELMPVNEFEGNSSWGYNPSFYFAPDKYYGPKNDLKRLVDECHKRGIAVVIDMVLNHSYGQSPLVRMYWDVANNRPAANNPWYNVTSNFLNPDAQWGYDFNHDSPYTRELVDSINSFWMSEYHVDGFRFDFTKGFSNTSYPASSWGSTYDADRIENLERMSDEIWKRKPGALVICEHLADNSEEKVLAAHGLLLWGNMNYNYGESAMGYTANSDLSNGVYTKRGWSEPNLVTYQESHDEERLTYKCQTWGNALGSYDIKNVETSIDRMKLNAVFHLLLPGPKMIWQFGELGYDYSINTCSDGVTVSDGCRLAEKPVRWDYTANAKRAELFRVYADLNYLKKNYDEFSSTDFSISLTGAQKTFTTNANNQHVVVIGNFALEEAIVTVNFARTGTWYNYFERTSFDVSSSSMSITLQPGEYKIFSTREFAHPAISSVDIGEMEKAWLKLYPNPVTDYLLLGGDVVMSVDVFNVWSECVISETYSDQENSRLIDFQHLKKGVYVVKVTTRSGEFLSGRVLKN